MVFLQSLERTGGQDAKRQVMQPEEKTQDIRFSIDHLGNDANGTEKDAAVTENG